jgi:hypothetical protein
MYALDELEHFVRLSLEIGIVVVIFQAEKQDNNYHNNPRPIVFANPAVTTTIKTHGNPPFYVARLLKKSFSNIFYAQHHYLVKTVSLN